MRFGSMMEQSQQQNRSADTRQGGESMKPLHESIEVTLSVPRHVGGIWRSLGWTEADYQRCFFDVIRAHFDTVSEVPAAK